MESEENQGLTIESEQSLLFAKYGVIFAFSQSQFDEQKQEGVKYSQCGMGMFMPYVNVEAFFKELGDLHVAGRAKRVKEFGPNGVIEKEYFNYETQITGDVASLIENLEPYIEQFPELFTNQRILDVSKKCMAKAIENDWF
jgi:hypothetical protein